jgi:nitrogen fixation protein FixH
MTAGTSEKPLTGRVVLIYLIAFFAVVVGVNMTMMKLAVDTLSGTEVDSAYRASLAYNAQISAAHEQDARGWRVTVHVDHAPGAHASVRIEARDKTGEPVTGAAFSAQFARPTDKKADRRIALVEREAGIYRGEAPDIASGQWDLVIEATGATERLFLSRNRIVLK